MRLHSKGARRRCALAAGVLLLAAAGRAGAQGTMPPSGPAHATSMEMDREIRTFLLGEVLEVAPAAGDRPIRVDALGWVGGDYNRIYFRLDGEQPTRGSGGETEFEANYGRLLTPFWTGLVGARLDTRRFGDNGRDTRVLLALGFEGMSQYWFEVEPSLYVSPKGDVSGRFAGAFDILLSQRLILQPRVETHFAVQRVPEIGVGSGINDVEVGARLRYEIRREFAPYVGTFWSGRTGATAGLARRAGEPVRESGIVVGVRMWR